MTRLEEKLAGWTGPSSDTEQEKQERTERMIREAVAGHAALNGCGLPQLNQMPSGQIKVASTAKSLVNISSELTTRGTG